MKITKPQAASLKHLMEYQGAAVLSSEWTTGLGRYTKRRVVPPFCKRIERGLHENYPKRIRRVFERHPKAKVVVAVVDMRAAKKAIEEKEKRNA